MGRKGRCIMGEGEVMFVCVIIQCHACWVMGEGGREGQVDEEK